MNILTAVTNLFKKPANRQAAQRWREGFDAFQEGKNLYHTENQPQQALRYFDIAVALGIEDGTLYASRGSCLQVLDFHLDAINDFSKAIEFEQGDSNYYYMRSNSRQAIGDCHGSAADLNEAIRVAGIDNAANRSHDAWAKGRGHAGGIAELYRMDLLRVNLDLALEADTYARLTERRRQAGSQRRPQDLSVVHLATKPEESAPSVPSRIRTWWVGFKGEMRESPIKTILAYGLGVPLLALMAIWGVVVCLALAGAIFLAVKEHLTASLYIGLGVIGGLALGYHFFRSPADKARDATEGNKQDYD